MSSTTRRSNLKRWFAARSVPAAERSYFSQLMGGKASFGEKAARRIEKDYGMPSGYLDSEESSGQKSNYTTFDLLDVTASPGPGAAALDAPEVVQRVQVLESWALRELGGNLSRIKLITARGDSMSGTIEDRDVLFVDASVQEYAGEGVYVIAVGGEVQVKRLQRLISGGLRVISDNAARYPAQDVTQEEAALSALRVCGRVLVTWDLKRVG